MAVSRADTTARIGLTPAHMKHPANENIIMKDPKQQSSNRQCTNVRPSRSFPTDKFQQESHGADFFASSCSKANVEDASLETSNPSENSKFTFHFVDSRQVRGGTAMRKAKKKPNTEKMDPNSLSLLSSVADTRTDPYRQGFGLILIMILFLQDAHFVF